MSIYPETKHPTFFANEGTFVSAPDLDGDQFSFGIAFAGTADYAGSIVSKAHGLNAELLPPTVDHTEIYIIATD